MVRLLDLKRRCHSAGSGTPEVQAADKAAWAAMRRLIGAARVRPVSRPARLGSRPLTPPLAIALERCPRCRWFMHPS